MRHIAAVPIQVSTSIVFCRGGTALVLDDVENRRADGLAHAVVGLVNDVT
jgi:hypothetical protein